MLITNILTTHQQGQMEKTATQKVSIFCIVSNSYQFTVTDWCILKGLGPEKESICNFQNAPLMRCVSGKGENVWEKEHFLCSPRNFLLVHWLFLIPIRPIIQLQYVFQHFLKGQCHEIFFASSFFHESVSPQPQSIPLGKFRIFRKIRGDIRKSRCTTGINDTSGKLI